MDASARERPDALEWAGWALLALLTLSILALVLLRPTDPAGMFNEIRLAAGFDRYEAAIDEGDRIHSTVVAELRRTARDDVERRASLYAMLEEAVALAGEFSGVYPRESPGGWQLLGHTDTAVFDLHREPAALLRPGVRVRFVDAG